MSVYVDHLMTCIPKGRFRWTSSCHLFADSVVELHLFAARIGMKREWFQISNGRKLSHYDLNETRRALAIQLGAIELDRRQTVAKWNEIAPRKRPSPTNERSGG